MENINKTIVSQEELLKKEQEDFFASMQEILEANLDDGDLLGVQENLSKKEIQERLDALFNIFSTH